MGTFEAAEAVARRWKIEPQRLAYGGLKDRHAVTSQLVTILHGPRRGMAESSFELVYLGQACRSFRSEEIVANRFRIVLRDLDAAEVAAALAALQEIERDGLANYFDRQRFGSVGPSGEFVAQPWCRGDYERTVWLALAEPNEHDRPRDRAEKASLRQHWGDWSACRAQVSEPGRRQVVEHLAQRPRDFRGAIARIDHHLRSMYLAAFQSFLWNEMLAEWLRAACQQEETVAVPLNGRTYPFPGRLDEPQRSKLAAAMLPLPSARLRLEAGPLRDLIDSVLARHGVELRTLRVKYPRDTFFSKGDRPVIARAGHLTCETGADEIYPGRKRLTLGFELPRGAYATALVARITLALA
jgi:tRNA pseudouridine13 synthase